MSVTTLSTSDDRPSTPSSSPLRPTARRRERPPRRGERRGAAADRERRRRLASMRSAELDLRAQRLGRARLGSPAAVLVSRSRAASSVLACHRVELLRPRSRSPARGSATCQLSLTPVCTRSPISASRSRSGPGLGRLHGAVEARLGLQRGRARTLATAQPSANGSMCSRFGARGMANATRPAHASAPTPAAADEGETRRRSRPRLRRPRAGSHRARSWPGRRAG